MNYEDLQDDFSPIVDNSVTDNDEACELNKVGDSLQISEGHFIVPEHKKKVSSKLIAVISILLAVSAFLSVFFTHDAFKKYRQNFVVNVKIIDSSLGISDKFEKVFKREKKDLLKKREENKAMGTTYDNETYLIPFENASNSQFFLAEEGIVVAKSNYIACLNEKGETVWATNTSVVNPILSVDGKYMCIAEKGGTKVCLFEKNKLIYDTDAQNAILNANVSAQGDVVVVTKKEFFKGAVEVINKNGERVFSWGSGTNSVLCADIAPSSRRIAVGFLDSKKNIVGSVQLFKIDEKESYKTIEIPGTVVFDLEFTGETLNVFGDDRFVGITVHGDVIWDETFDGNLTAYAYDNSGNKTAVVDNHNLPVVKTYEKKGHERQEINVDELPDFVDISDRYLLFNNTRMIFFGKNSNLKKYVATMDVKGLKIINNNVYLIIYNNSLEFVHV